MVGIYQHPAYEDAYADGMSFLDGKPGKEDGWKESETLGAGELMGRSTSY